MSALIDSRPRPRPRRRLAVYKTVRPDLVEVVVSGDTVGYIEVAGRVFVALRGPRYDTAVEVAQSVSIEVAHRALCAGLDGLERE